jgi:amino acid adenylation domain-containing protein
MPSLYDLVARQVARTPNLPAVISGSDSFTYQQLDERAEAIARRLNALGVKPDTLVGLCVERSADMIAGVLGILRAGGAFVPLDPAYPPDRLEYMLADTAAPIVLAQRSTLDRLPSFTGELILLDDVPHTVTGVPPNWPPLEPHHLAYIIYTSGSTGRPKGAMIEHRNIVPFVQWIPEFFHSEDLAYVLCANSLSFDVSVFEIFAALANGGTAVIVRNILDLLLHPPSAPISLLFSAPSSLTEIVRAGALPASLRAIVVGGERITHSLAREVYATSNVQTLYNTWGVTEDTICATTLLVWPTLEEDPSIGKAIRGRELYILDENLVPLPPGVHGELYCTGYGVGRGYLHRPELTAERFLTSPFDPSMRLYRTGDIAMMDEHGDFHFIGRNDQQVKVNGFRIELGEIESVLHAYPGVAQIVVAVRQGASILDMYAVEKSPGALSLAPMQRYVSERLPPYMVPDSLTIVESMPIGPTGKLDRKALQTHKVSRPEFFRSFVSPIDRYEEQLARMFAELLFLEHVGTHDNFFALGGKSLLAARLATEIRGVFPTEVAAIEERFGAGAMHAAFAFEPTVRHLAAILQGQELPQHEIKSLQCLQVGVAGVAPLFIFHGVINGEAFYSYNLTYALDPKQPVYILAPHGSDGSSVPESIEEMAQDYLEQIRAVQAQGPYHFIGYCNGGLVAYEVACMLEQCGQSVETLVLIASPGHNIRFQPLKTVVDYLRWVPGLCVSKRRRIFLQTRETLRLLKWHAHHALSALKAWRGRQFFHWGDPVGQFREARLLGNAEQREDPRFYRILQAVDAYVPGRFHGKICLMWGREDEYLQSYDPLRDWSRTVNSLHYHIVEGGHTFLDSRPELVLEHFPHGLGEDNIVAA